MGDEGRERGRELLRFGPGELWRVLETFSTSAVGQTEYLSVLYILLESWIGKVNEMGGKWSGKGN